MRSATHTHTGVLIAVSLLRGEEMEYLKTSPTLPFPQLHRYSVPYFFPPLVTLFSPSRCFFLLLHRMFSPSTASKGGFEKDPTTSHGSVSVYEDVLSNKGS